MTEETIRAAGCVLWRRSPVDGALAYSNVAQVTISGSNGGGGGNKPPSSSTTQPLVITDQPAGLSLLQELLDMLWADIRLVESLLASVSSSLGQGI